MNILHTLFVQLTHRDKIATLDIPVLIVGFLLLIARDFQREDQLLNVVVWSVVIFSCLITSLNYILILRLTWNTIRSNIIVWKSLTILVLGLISSYILLRNIWKAWDNIAQAKFELFQTVLFCCTAVIRIVHCYLGVLFFSLVYPISNIWVSHHAQATIIQLDSMIYCKVFLYIHWLMVTITFGGEQNSATLFLHIFSLVYRTIGLIWIWIMKIRSATQDVLITPIQETGLRVSNSTLVVGTVVTAAIIVNTLAGSEIVFPQWGLQVH